MTSHLEHCALSVFNLLKFKMTNLFFKNKQAYSRAVGGFQRGLIMVRRQKDRQFSQRCDSQDSVPSAARGQGSHLIFHMLAPVIQLLLSVPRHVSDKQTRPRVRLRSSFTLEQLRVTQRTHGSQRVK